MRQGATSEQRKARGQLPTNAPAGTKQLFYVGKCPCCGDKYLANKDALQCGNKATHKTRGYGDTLLTLNRRVCSDKGERVGEKAAPAKTASIASFMEKA